MAHNCRVNRIPGSTTGGNAGTSGRARRTAALALVVLMPVAALLPADAANAANAANAAGLAAIPPRYLTWYRAATRTCPRLSWEVLAGIGTMESNNGRSNARGVHQGKNRMGAEGPMQFEPATFAEYAVKVDPSRRLTPYDPADAIFTAARMLCADGAAGGSPTGLRRAIFAYNHACWYVRDVLAIAARYTAAARPLHHARKHRAKQHQQHKRQHGQHKQKQHGQHGQKQRGQHGQHGQHGQKAEAARAARAEAARAARAAQATAQAEPPTS